MTDPLTLRGKKRRGRLRANEVVLQQLSNGQFLLTIPRLWVDILHLQKGDPVTFTPTSGGIELSPATKRRAQKR